MSEKLLEVKELKKYFKTPGGMLHAVDGVTFDIEEGRTLGVVGESGCGKSTLGRTVLGLLDSTDGSVKFMGEETVGVSKAKRKELRKNMQIIFQDPFSSLNPRMCVSELIAEPLKVYKMCKTKEELNKRVAELMETVGLAERLAFAYPHELDGGRRQRIGIARALALNPKFIVCDEPVSALDVSIQSQVLNLLDDLQDQYGLTYLFISHDLSVVRHISDRVCVMFLGMVCELGDTNDIYEHPIHPYTKFLLDAVPKPDPTQRDDDKELLAGEIPSPVDPPSGCRFRTRCPYATEKCAEEVPEMRAYGDRMVACHHPLI